MELWQRPSTTWIYHCLLFIYLLIFPRSCNPQDLLYAIPHPDIRAINLATDLKITLPQLLYPGTCDQEQYVKWYWSDYPSECHHTFRNATSLHDLFQIYCDPLCGGLYHTYLASCNKNDNTLADHYREKCEKNEHSVGHLITTYSHQGQKKKVDKEYINKEGLSTERCYSLSVNFVSEVGCFVNILYSETYSHNTHHKTVWKKCQIEVPLQFCGVDKSIAAVNNWNILFILTIVSFATLLSSL